LATEPTLYLLIIVIVALLIVGMIWAVLHVRRSGKGKHRAGTYALMYSLFFGFGTMFDGATAQTELVADPERKNRAERGGPPKAPKK